MKDAYCISDSRRSICNMMRMCYVILDTKGLWDVTGVTETHTLTRDTFIYRKQ